MHLNLHLHIALDVLVFPEPGLVFRFCLTNIPLSGGVAVFPSDMNEVTLPLNHMHTFSKKDFELEGDLQKRHCNRLMDLCIAVRFDARFEDCYYFVWFVFLWKVRF